MIGVPDLETMDRAALLAAWSEIFGTPVPRGLSQAFMRRFLAFEVQAQRSGGLPKGFGAKLERVARSLRRGAPRTPALRPGGRLLREWNGVTHVVEVTDIGFLWNGECHRSLTAIAREITGAHWSGPRFFGLSGTGAP